MEGATTPPRRRVCLAGCPRELDPVRALLDELGIAWTAHRPERPEPADLLISTPQVAIASDVRGEVSASGHIVVGRELSRTLRRQLERHPCDFVVELPVEASTLHALVEHALYRGPERRHGLRARIGVEVELKAGLRTKKARLLQLSDRGCGLLVEQPITADEVTLQLPAACTAGRRLDLRARLLDQHGRSEGGHVASLGFFRPDAATRKQLREIMHREAAHDGLLQPTGRRRAAPSDPAAESQEHAAAKAPAPAATAVAAPRETTAGDQRRSAPGPFEESSSRPCTATRRP